MGVEVGDPAQQDWAGREMEEETVPYVALIATNSIENQINSPERPAPFATTGTSVAHKMSEVPAPPRLYGSHSRAV